MLGNESIESKDSIHKTKKGNPLIQKPISLALDIVEREEIRRQVPISSDSKFWFIFIIGLYIAG